MIKRFIISAAAAALLPAAALAQIGLPGLPGLPRLPELPRADLPDLPEVQGDLLSNLERLSPVELAKVLNEARLERLSRFIKDNRREVIADENGNPAVRGVVLVTGGSAEMLDAALRTGFRLLHSEEVAGLGLSFARLAPPKGMSEAAAARLAQRLMPTAEVSLDHYYLPSGSVPGTAQAAVGGGIATGFGRVGIVDGGIGRARGLPKAEQRGFAPGAPRPDDHATALASLVAGGKPQRPAAPGARLYVADVYGKGPKGGTASAIAQALGWLAEGEVSVVAVSLVGPDNPLLRKAVRAAQGRGMIIVAAVGNDGPAAPPAYPASFRGVLAVTGTDPDGRVLPEAGRALHLDFAAPGSGIKAHDRSGRMKAVRGTSFAVPLVAGRLAMHYPRPDIAGIETAVRKLIAEARDVGEKGRDSTFGHGLVCGECGAR